MRDHYKKERDDARAELKRLRDSIAALSGVTPAPSPPVPASTPYSPPGSLNGRHMATVARTQRDADGRHASADGAQHANAARPRDDDAGTIYEDLYTANEDVDDDQTVYGAFD